MELSRVLAPLVGPRDAVMVTSPEGDCLVAIHADALLIPASILKLITVLAAMENLGGDYRFRTEFFLDEDRNLIIKGYGDPMLISERIATIAVRLARELPSFHRLMVDDTYFAPRPNVPGRSVSGQPYDAPNGALCVNFNTVAFRRNQGRWVSDEPQTPLLEAVIPRIEASGLTSGRITLVADSTEALAYSGGLFRYFFEQAGIVSKDGVGRGRVDPEKDRLIWRYRSEDDLGQIARDLLTFSNNFIANQILLVMGAEIHGPPATVEKGLRVLRKYCRDELGMTAGNIVEGSGISRRNRISARVMMTALERLEPHHTLLRQIRGWQFYKTGHLKGIRTRAGYLTSSRGGHYRFVVMLNTPGKTPHGIMKVLERRLR